MRRRLPKIENETSIRGDDLRRLVSAALAHERRKGRFEHRLCVIYFLPAHGFYSHGVAYVDDAFINIYVARGWSGRRWEITEIAQLIEHELGHMRLGHRHTRELPSAWWRIDPQWSARALLRLRKGRQPSQLESRIRADLEELSIIDGAS